MVDTKAKPKPMTIYIAKLGIVSVNSKVLRYKDLPLAPRSGNGRLLLSMQPAYPGRMAKDRLAEVKSGSSGHAAA